MLLDVKDTKMEKWLAVYAALILAVSGTVLDIDVCMFSCKHVVVLARILVGNIIKICVSGQCVAVPGNDINIFVGNNVGVMVDKKVEI